MREERGRWGAKRGLCGCSLVEVDLAVAVFVDHFDDLAHALERQFLARLEQHVLRKKGRGLAGRRRQKEARVTDAH